MSSVCINLSTYKIIRVITQENFLKGFLKITSALQYMYLQLNYASSKIKVDSITFISFQENYQTAEIYFYSYHVIPLNKTISN